MTFTLESKSFERLKTLWKLAAEEGGDYPKSMEDYISRLIDATYNRWSEDVYIQDCMGSPDWSDGAIQNEIEAKTDILMDEVIERQARIKGGLEKGYPAGDVFQMFSWRVCSEDLLAEDKVMVSVIKTHRLNRRGLAWEHKGWSISQQGIVELAKIYAYMKDYERESIQCGDETFEIYGIKGYK